MLAEFWQLLTAWSPLDTDITVTAALTAMACSLPGLWLVLRRQSMMGDALSHTALPGVILSMLAVTGAQAMGWVSPDQVDLTKQIALIVGAVAMGMVTTLLTEWLQNISSIDGGTALGVIFTGLFAMGLVLVRVFTDDAHIDPDCVLYGQLEGVVHHTWTWGGREVPKAAVLTGVLLLLNLALTIVFFKELRLAAFDAELATTQGIPARGMHYAHMALTAATVTSSFQSVGSILVIALLVVPAVTALQLSHRLSKVVVVTLGLASLSAILGQVMAKTLPPLICRPLGWNDVHDASSSGMVCVAAGLLFLTAAVCGPRGVLLDGWARMRLGWQIAEEDVLGTLFRAEEAAAGNKTETKTDVTVRSAWRERFLLQRLRWQGLLQTGRSGGPQLTTAGQNRAQDIVRRHRLWESYMQKHFALPDDHLHEAAHRIEHYIDPTLQRALDSELDTPGTDPHGRKIPGPGTPPT